MKRLLYLALVLCCAVACKQKPAPVVEPASEAQDSLVEEIVAEPDTFVYFQTEEDVRAYLCKHIYKNDENFVLAFNENANEITYNEMPVSHTTVIEEFNDTMALVKSSGMLGNTTIRFTALPTGNVIEDLNDGILYWEHDK
jgi:hypothetical protein